MAEGATLEFTDDNFEQEVLQSSVPVLVDFWAEWCQPCLMLGPTIEDIATEYDGRAKVGKMNTDACYKTAVKYSIQSIPTCIIFKGGEPVDSIGGMQGKETYTQALEKHL